MLIDGRGVPLGAAVDGANVHDQKLVKETLDSIPVERPQPTPRKPQHLCLDKGYTGEPIEREARRNLAPQTKVDGLYNRQPARPTGRLILTALASLRLIPATATTPAQITRPTPVQARLLKLLGVDPTRPP